MYYIKTANFFPIDCNLIKQLYSFRFHFLFFRTRSLWPPLYIYTPYINADVLTEYANLPSLRRVDVDRWRLAVGFVVSVVHVFLFADLSATAQRLVRVFDRWRERQHACSYVSVRACLLRWKQKKKKPVSSQTQYYYNIILHVSCHMYLFRTNHNVLIINPSRVAVRNRVSNGTTVAPDF